MDNQPPDVEIVRHTHPQKEIVRPSDREPYADLATERQLYSEWFQTKLQELIEADGFVQGHRVPTWEWERISVWDPPPSYPDWGQATLGPSWMINAGNCSLLYAAYLYAPLELLEALFTRTLDTVVIRNNRYRRWLLGHVSLRKVANYQEPDARGLLGVLRWPVFRITSREFHDKSGVVQEMYTEKVAAAYKAFQERSEHA